MGRPKLEPQQKEFLRKNYLMYDAELARHLGLGVQLLGRQRRAMGLVKKRGRKKGTGVKGVVFKSKVSREWLEQALTKCGKTEGDIARQFGVSRERVRQVCEDWGIEPNRTPKWWANRYGKPEFADKAWLEEELKKASGVSCLSRQINLSPAIISAQAKRLDLEFPLPTYRAERVEITCEVCGKKKTRKKSEIKGKKHTFCSRVCLGKWLGTNWGRASSWLEREDEFIRTNYEKMTDAEMAGELGRRTPGAVEWRRLQKLGLKKRPRRKYSKEDNAFLKANYLQMADKKMAEALGRTRASVAEARRRRGLQKRSRAS